MSDTVTITKAEQDAIIRARVEAMRLADFTELARGLDDSTIDLADDRAAVLRALKVTP